MNAIENYKSIIKFYIDEWIGNDYPHEDDNDFAEWKEKLALWEKISSREDAEIWLEKFGYEKSILEEKFDLKAIPKNLYLLGKNVHRT